MALVLPEGKGKSNKRRIPAGPGDRMGGLVVIAPARRAGDPGSNPGPARILSLKLFLSIFLC